MEWIYLHGNLRNWWFLSWAATFNINKCSSGRQNCREIRCLWKFSPFSTPKWPLQEQLLSLLLALIAPLFVRFALSSFHAPCKKRLWLESRAHFASKAASAKTTVCITPAILEISCAIWCLLRACNTLDTHFFYFFLCFRILLPALGSEHDFERCMYVKLQKKWAAHVINVLLFLYTIAIWQLLIKD